ncbi:hypothetical protein NXW84_06330 [Bacteroides fragilis]|nr:hypothetical protein NXW84_06330 [Bacteroides fragilis]
MYFNDDEIRRIKDAATGHLLDVAQDFHELKRSGVNYNCDCPCELQSRKETLN